MLANIRGKEIRLIVLVLCFFSLDIIHGSGKTNFNIGKGNNKNERIIIGRDKRNLLNDKGILQLNHDLF